ncbi:hypothetical protein JD844_016018 [Phrynosoma platyrhinos]|uniref:Alpha-carbonic anhydrase domain-containing protein n=1 Tax=Phrynosoma platyrhinos TaxID=52577 RepID=A0ABQ7SJR7_PHRPL|nr:hypothetical protein JD844_016018 [Phrynosoma platyrhinos]
MSHPPWSYSKEKGPDHWHESYPFARGNNQSPISIITKNVHKDPILLPWFTGYDPGASKTIKNTGKTCRIAFDDTFDRSGVYSYGENVNYYDHEELIARY